MKSHRRPRFKCDPDAAPLQLTERDQQIIRLVHRYRFLRSQQVVALIGSNHQPLLRRLHLLYHHGYLERPRAQLEYFHQGGSRPMVYGLGDKGAALLKREVGIRWGAKNRSVGRMFLEHALLVSEVIVVMELACRKSGIRLLMDEDLPLPNTAGGKCPSFKWHVKVNSRLKLGVVPDRVFGLEFSDASGEPSRAYFFLEADRGTMPVTRRHLSQTSFHRKLLAYEATWAQSLHQTRFGFHRFRVLTVTTSAERVQSLVDACGKLKSGHGLFLFANRSVLESPDNILSALWQTGRPGETASLLD
jgi:hypothetical protein